MAGEKTYSGNLRLMANGKVIFDAISSTLSLSRETTTTPGTKDTAAGKPRKGTKSFTASYSGLGVYAGDGNGGHNFKDLLDVFNDDSSSEVHIEFVPEETDADFYFEGDGIITALEGVFAFSETATVTMSIAGQEITAVDRNVTAPGA